MRLAYIFLLLCLSFNVNAFGGFGGFLSPPKPINPVDLFKTQMDCHTDNYGEAFSSTNCVANKTSIEMAKSAGLDDEEIKKILGQCKVLGDVASQQLCSTKSLEDKVKEKNAIPDNNQLNANKTQENNIENTLNNGNNQGVAQNMAIGSQSGGAQYTNGTEGMSMKAQAGKSACGGRGVKTIINNINMELVKQRCYQAYSFMKNEMKDCIALQKSLNEKSSLKMIADACS